MPLQRPRADNQAERKQLARICALARLRPGGPENHKTYIEILFSLPLSNRKRASAQFVVGCLRPGRPGEPKTYIDLFSSLLSPASSAPARSSRLGVLVRLVFSFWCLCFVFFCRWAWAWQGAYGLKTLLVGVMLLFCSAALFCRLTAVPS